MLLFCYCVWSLQPDSELPRPVSRLVSQPSLRLEIPSHTLKDDIVPAGIGPPNQTLVPPALRLGSSRSCNGSPQQEAQNPEVEHG